MKRAIKTAFPNPSGSIFGRSFRLARIIKNEGDSLPPWIDQAVRLILRKGEDLEDAILAVEEALPRVIYAVGESPVDRAFRLARANPIPDERKGVMRVGIVGAAAWYLVNLTDESVFPLAIGVVQKQFRLKHSEASRRIIENSIKRGYIKIEDGNYSYIRKRARTFRLGPYFTGDTLPPWKP